MNCKTFSLRRTLGQAFLVLALVPAFLQANDLNDLSLSGGKSPTLKFIFAQGNKAEDFPLYFQKVDEDARTVTICFLETASPLPLGRMNLPPEAPVTGMALKKVTTPSGRSFLGVEIAFAELPTQELNLLPGGGSSLKITLAGKGGSKLKWLASQGISQGSTPAALVETPPAPPVEPAVSIPAEPTPSVETKTLPTAPEPVATPAPMPAPAPSMPTTKSETPTAPAPTVSGQVEDLQIVAGSEQEDLLFIGKDLGSSYAISRDNKDSLLLVLGIAGAKIALPAKSYHPPKASLFASIKLKQGSDTAFFLIRLRRPLSAQVGMAGNQIAVTLPATGGQGLKWSARQGQTFSAALPTESGPSALAEGQTLDQGKSGLSSSRVFQPSGAGKPMVLLRDSAALREKPAPKAKSIKTLPAGAQIMKVENEGEWLRVVSEGDTGYLPRKAAVYADEMTMAQEAQLQKTLATLAKARQIAEEREAAKARKLAIADSIRIAKEQARLAASAAQTPAVEIPAATQVTVEPTPQVPAQPEMAEVKPEVKSEATMPENAVEKTTEPAQVKAPKASTPVSQAQLHIATNDEQKLAETNDPALREKLDQERLTAEQDKQKNKENEPVNYNSYGRRDPFIPVAEGNTDNGIDIDQMKVVGVVWHPSDPMAVLQHLKEASVSFTVKQGDPVHNGRVSRITRDAVTFDITEYGISRSYSLKLVSMQERAKK